MKRQRDDHALATLMQAAQGGDTQAYVLLLKEITPRLRQIVRGEHRFLKTEDMRVLPATSGLPHSTFATSVPVFATFDCC